MHEMRNLKTRSLAVAAVLSLTMGLLAALPMPASAAYEPEWMPEADLGLERSQAVVVTDEDGMIYVIGGYSNVSTLPLADVNRYDPDTGDWEELAPLPFATRGACGEVGYDGRVYVFGGTGASSLTQIYDPDTDSWSAGTAIPESLWEAKSARYSQYIYILGGEGSVGDDSDVYRYDASADSWSSVTNLPEPRVSGAAVRLGSYLYYIGGCSLGYSDPQTTVYRFYMWGTTWEEVAPLPVPMAAQAAVVGADGLIYVLGGSDTAYNTLGSFDVNGYVYDSYNDAWTELMDRSEGKKYLGAAATDDGRIFAVGGNDGTDVFATVESIATMSRTVEVASSSVTAGGQIVMSFESDPAYATEVGSGIEWFLMSSDDEVYDSGAFWVPIDGTGVVSVDVPEFAAPGDYMVVFYMSTYLENTDFYWPETEIDIVVLDSYSLEEQLAMLEANVSALSDELQGIIDVQAEDIAVLQEALDDLAAQLSTMDGNASDLADEIAALQDQIDALQETVATSDSGDDSTMLYAIIGLLVVVIVLLLVMMMMSRGKPSASPPPPPEQ